LLLSLSWMESALVGRFLDAEANKAGLSPPLLRRIIEPEVPRWNCFGRSNMAGAFGGNDLGEFAEIGKSRGFSDPACFAGSSPGPTSATAGSWANGEYWFLSFLWRVLIDNNLEAVSTTPMRQNV